MVCVSAGTAVANNGPTTAMSDATAMSDSPCPVDTTGHWALAPYVLQNDWAWRCRYAEANRQWNAEHPAQVVFIGDSITEGWVHHDPSLFTHGVVGRGLSGQTSAQLVVRFWQDVVALHPKAVHIMVGTNDLAGNTGPSSLTDYQNAIRSMVAMARANDIAVVLGSVLPADRFDWKQELHPAAQIVVLNDWLREFATEEGLVYADYYGAMVGPNGNLRSEWGPDGVHPNEAGYAVMRPIADAALAQALAQ